jgi:hypothetical protein
MATRETWKKRVAGWRASGLSAENFALGRGFNADALREMGKQLLRVEPAVRLARVEIVPERVCEVPVVLRAGAVRVEVVRGFSRETLAAVLDVIEGRQR